MFVDFVLDALRSRAALTGRRYGETKAATEFAEPAVNLADCSGSWYHAAAIQESKPGVQRRETPNATKLEKDA
jgi:hypothetical protein